ncbi:MAG: methyltransferase domain-containing protein [Actinobacteria bacterium]|nr:methyltransferase domain-containing protein [Actinomycetota bacterium]
MTDDAARIVAAGYDAVADCYEALEAPDAPWPRLRRLEGMLELVPEGAAVLDAGCGNGVPALAAIVRRHRAFGIDVSPEQVTRARRNVPEAVVLEADLAAASFEPGSFGAVVCFYALEHVPRLEHAAVLDRFHDWLHAGGYLLFTVEAREAHDVVGDWLGRPMFFSQFGPEETLELVRKAGFDVLRADVEGQLEGGREIEYLWVLARRSK